MLPLIARFLSKPAAAQTGLRMVAVWLLWSMTVAAFAQTTVEVIALKYRPAEQLIPVIQPLLGRESSVSSFQNQLVVRATAAELAQVRRVLASLDTAPRRLLITVRQDADFERDRREAEVSASVGSGEARATVPGSGAREGGQVVLRDGEEIVRSQVGELPPQPGHLLLCTGDQVLLSADPAPGRPARRDAAGTVQEVARIPCSLPEALAEVRPGQSIAFDDGAIAGVIESATPEAALVRITRAKPGGAKLRADKGINLPETELSLPALTSRDREDLQVAVEIADLVGMSFVRRPADVLSLHDALAQADAAQLHFAEDARGVGERLLHIVDEDSPARQRIQSAHMRTQPPHRSQPEIQLHSGVIGVDLPLAVVHCGKAL